jgi:hypothetical protein
MNRLYRNELRLLLNYFQPSVKLVKRTRVGSRIRRIYDAPKTPFQRLVELNALLPERVAAMKAEQQGLDRFALAAAVEAAVVAVLSIPSSPVQRRVSSRSRAVMGAVYSAGSARKLPLRPPLR